MEVALEMQFKCLKRATEVTAAGETEIAKSLLDIAGGTDSQEDLVRELEEQVVRPAAADSDAQPGGLALLGPGAISYQLGVLRICTASTSGNAL